jgi:hypothetical protein
MQITSINAADATQTVELNSIGWARFKLRSESFAKWVSRLSGSSYTGERQLEVLSITRLRRVVRPGSHFSKRKEVT